MAKPRMPLTWVFRVEGLGLNRPVPGGLRFWGFEVASFRVQGNYSRCVCISIPIASPAKSANMAVIGVEVPVRTGF